MKKIVIICSILLVFVISACSIKQVPESKMDVINNNIINESTTMERPSEINYIYEIENVASNINDEVSNYPIIQFGKYEQDGNKNNGAEPVQWLLLDDIDEKLLLMSKEILYYSSDTLNDNVCMVYDEKEDDEGNIILDNKTILNRLNKALEIEIREEEKGYVVPVSFNVNNEIEYNYGDTDDEYYGKYGTWGKTFCLSEKEIEKYFGRMESDGTNKKSIAKGTPISKHNGLKVSDKDTWYFDCGGYFLRDIVKDGDKKYLKFVGKYGHIYDDNIEIPSKDTGIGIRPCIVVDKNCPSLNDKIYKIDGKILQQKLIYVGGKIYGTDNEGKIAKNVICSDRYGNKYLTNENGEVDILNVQFDHFFKMSYVKYPYITGENGKKFLLNIDGTINKDYYTSKYTIDRNNGLLIRFNDDLSIAEKYNIKDTITIRDEWNVATNRNDKPVKYRIVDVECDYDDNLKYGLKKFINHNKIVVTDNKKMYIKVTDDKDHNSNIDIRKKGKGFVKEDNDKMRFYNDDASICHSGIYNINGKKYVFDDDGYLVKNGNYFVFLANNDGILVEEKGLVKIGNSYYINDDNDEFFLDIEKGYNLANCSLCINTFHKIDNAIYYCKENGQCAKNEWITDRYYFDKNGKLTVGEFNINDKKLLNENNSYVRYYYLY